MADDTRQPPPAPTPPTTPHPLNQHPTNQPFTTTQWQNGQASPYKPPESANMMAGGTQHTAGGKVPDVTISNAVGRIRMDDLWDLPKRPCVRDALLVGIGAGFAVGGTRAIFRATVWRACNWAVGSASVGAMGMYNYCLYRRQAERDGMMRAVEILNGKDVEKRAREARKEKAREERRRLQETQQDKNFEAAGKVVGAQGADRRWWEVW